jgi:hypothetical protein
MIVLYLIGLGLGVSLAVFANRLICYGFKMQSKALRVLLVCAHCLSAILAVILSDYILSIVYYGIANAQSKPFFLLSWIIPYAVVVMWSMIHYDKRKRDK